MAKLALSRKWRLVDRGRSWQVIIDEEVAGSIANDQAIEFPVDPGQHTLRLRRSWSLTSSQRSFEAEDGQVARFSCNAQLLWPMMVASLVKHDLWIVLRPD
jgi:hypothetical protein